MSFYVQLINLDDREDDCYETVELASAIYIADMAIADGLYGVSPPDQVWVADELGNVAYQPATPVRA